MTAALQIVVVGHTNTGKTSLLRTLARDEEFGEVRDAPGTTRHVEVIELALADGTAVLNLVDTPGLEDPRGLLERLEQLPNRMHIDGPERIRRLLEDPEIAQPFEQECKVLRQVLGASAALYVVDSREPLLGKYREELTLLGDCGVPLLPVLNFVATSASRQDEWREQLRRLGFHAVVAFDTVVFDVEGEVRLYEKLRTLLDPHADPLQQLIQDRRRHGSWLRRAAAEYLAELLIDVAACLREIPGDLDPQSMRQRVLANQELIRGSEQQTVDALLRLFRFDPRQRPPDGLPLVQGRWGLDLFHPDALKFYGLRAGGGALAGAASGLAVDAATLGLTLGLGTMTGTVLGTLVGGTIPMRRRLWARAKGISEWRVADETLNLLFWRQHSLLLALLCRGHAAQGPLLRDRVPENGEAGALPAALLRPLRDARLHPQWSRLNTEVFDPARIDRQIAVQRLTDGIVETLG